MRRIAKWEEGRPISLPKRGIERAHEWYSEKHSLRLGKGTLVPPNVGYRQLEQASTEPRRQGGIETRTDRRGETCWQKSSRKRQAIAGLTSTGVDEEWSTIPEENRRLWDRNCTDRGGKQESVKGREGDNRSEAGAQRRLEASAAAVPARRRRRSAGQRNSACVEEGATSA